MPVRWCICCAALGGGSTRNGYSQCVLPALQQSESHRSGAQVWDCFGRQMYASTPFDFAVTSVAWSPNGLHFAVGLFESIRICDRTGWAYSKVLQSSRVSGGSTSECGLLFAG